jgi:hypothetical protein
LGEDEIVIRYLIEMADALEAAAAVEATANENPGTDS